MSGNLSNSLRHLSESPPTTYCSSQPPQGTYLIRLNFVSGNFLISHPDFTVIIFYYFYHVYRVKCLKHCKKCSVGITKKTIISVLWYNSLTAASLLSVQFSISLPYFEIVTKFLRLLCNCMILLSCNNVNIFVAYFLRNYKIYSLLFVTFLVIIVHLRIKWYDYTMNQTFPSAYCFPLLISFHNLHRGLAWFD